MDRDTLFFGKHARCACSLRVPNRTFAPIIFPTSMKTLSSLHTAAEGVTTLANIAAAPSAEDEERNELVDVERNEGLIHDVEIEYTKRVEAEREASLKVCSCGVHCRLFGNIDVNQSWRCLNKDSIGIVGIWPLLGACLAIPACVLTEVGFNHDVVDENVRAELSKTFHLVQPTTFSVRAASVGFLIIDIIITVLALGKCTVKMPGVLLSSRPSELEVSRLVPRVHKSSRLLTLML